MSCCCSRCCCLGGGSDNSETHRGILQPCFRRSKSLGKIAIPPKSKEDEGGPVMNRVGQGHEKEQKSNVSIVVMVLEE